MKVLVTGASGTVGSILTKRLLEMHPSVHCQSRADRISVGGETWIRFDLKDSAEALRHFPEWDIVFHLAAQTSTSMARQNPLHALRDNITGLVSLLEVLRTQERPPMVFIAGTVTQVGLPETFTIHEGLCDDPVTFYDVSKLAAELFLKQYVREGWIKGCCLRLATVYGAAGVEQAADRGIIDRIMSAAIAGQSISVYGEGEYLRDYVHVDDVVEAFLAAAENPDGVNGKSFVIGTGLAVTLKEAFEHAAKVAGTITGREVEIHHVDPPTDLSPIEFRSAVMDSQAFRDATGWAPRYDLAAGLAKTYGGQVT